MRKILFIGFILSAIIVHADDSLYAIDAEKSLVVDSVISDNSTLSETKNPKNIYEERLRVLNNNTPMDLGYNDKVQPFIDSYLGKNKDLIIGPSSLFLAGTCWRFGFEYENLPVTVPPPDPLIGLISA